MKERTTESHHKKQTTPFEKQVSTNLHFETQRISKHRGTIRKERGSSHVGSSNGISLLTKTLGTNVNNDQKMVFKNEEQ